MKRKELLIVLEKVYGAASMSDTIPILTHFLISDGRVAATDLEISVSADCPDLAGIECLVPAKMFLQAIKQIPHEEVDIRVDGKELKIQSQKIKNSLRITEVSDDFPPTRVDVEKWEKLPEGFGTALIACSICGIPEQPEFSGVYWGAEGFASSDRNRICYYNTAGPSSDPMILSGRLVGFLKSTGFPTDYMVLDNGIVFSYGEKDIQVFGRKVEATFPDSWNLFPATTPETIVISKEVKAALKRVGTFASMSGGTKKTGTAVSFGKEGMLLNFDGEDKFEEIVDIGTDNDWKFTTNPEWMKDVLAHCDRLAVIEVGKRKVVYLEGYDGKFKVLLPTKNEDE